VSRHTTRLLARLTFWSRWGDVEWMWAAAIVGAAAACLAAFLLVATLTSLAFVIRVALS
jgi:high-affinity Fe2+/Pb2+ permease